jgi:glycerol uptake facilitator-like aquaporin
LKLFSKFHHYFPAAGQKKGIHLTMAKIALGTTREATQPDCIKALIVEFVTTFLFVFAGVGSAMAASTYVRM